MVYLIHTHGPSHAHGLCCSLGPKRYTAKLCVPPDSTQCTCWVVHLLSCAPCAADKMLLLLTEQSHSTVLSSQIKADLPCLPLRCLLKVLPCKCAPPVRPLWPHMLKFYRVSHNAPSAVETKQSGTVMACCDGVFCKHLFERHVIPSIEHTLL